MPIEYQQDYKKTHSYALKIYNDPNMSDSLRDIYRALESRYVHEGRTIDPSFYNDLSDDSVARLTAIGFDCLLSLDEKIYHSAGETGLSTQEGSRVTKSTKDSEKGKIRLLIMHQLIWGFVMMSVNEGSVLGVTSSSNNFYP
ncbi:hypothetical protein Tco_1107670 [Tanacetum coccineum]